MPPPYEVQVTSRFFVYETGFLCVKAMAVDQAGLKLSDLPASASHVLGLKNCATTALLVLSYSSNSETARSIAETGH